MTNFEQIVLNTFRVLESSIGRVTTLDIKNSIRTTHPTMRCYQADVSEAMNNLVNDNIITDLTYDDNGKYREYYILNTTLTTTSPIVNHNPPIISNVSKTKLLEIIHTSKGRFFTVTWVKKDGSERTANGKVTEKKFQNKLGYIVLKTKKDEYKLVDPRTLKGALLNGVHYIVK